MPLHVGKSLANLLSVSNVRLLISITTIKTIKMQRLTPIHKPNKQPSIVVACGFYTVLLKYSLLYLLYCYKVFF